MEHDYLLKKLSNNMYDTLLRSKTWVNMETRKQSTSQLFL